MLWLWCGMFAAGGSAVVLAAVVAAGVWWGVVAALAAVSGTAYAALRDLADTDG